MNGEDTCEGWAVTLVVVSVLMLGCALEGEHGPQRACLSENGQEQPSDDIAIGLQASTKLAADDPGISFYWPSRVVARDRAMRELKRLLARQPNTTAVQCLIVDTYSQGGGSWAKYQNAFLYYAAGVSAADRTELARLGFVGVGEQEWKTMRPWMEGATRRKLKALIEPVNDYEAVLVISFYDGNCWRIEPWFYWGECEQRRDLVAGDVAIAKLICRVKKLTGKELLFYDTAWSIMFDERCKQLMEEE